MGRPAYYIVSKLFGTHWIPWDTIPCLGSDDVTPGGLQRRLAGLTAVYSADNPQGWNGARLQLTYGATIVSGTWNNGAMEFDQPPVVAA